MPIMQLSRGSKKKKIAPHVPIVIGIFVVLIIVCSTVRPIRTVVSSIGMTTMKPVLVFTKSLGEKVRSIGTYFYNKHSLATENVRLRTKEMETQSLLITAQALQVENTELKTMLGRHTEKKRILASVLVRPSETPYHTMVLDVGEKDGITPGLFVVAPGGFALGTVTNVYRTTAVVTLFSTPGIETSVHVVGADSVMTIIGDGNGSFQFIVPHGMKIEKETVLALPNLHAYPIAVVGGSLSEQSDSVKRVLARVPINIQGLTRVEVELP